MSDKFVITDQECACGCGTKMGSSAVERGWKFLRGHKAGAIGGGVKTGPRAPKTTPAEVTNLGAVTAFLQRNDKLLVDQIGEAHAEIDSLKKRIEAELKKIEALQANRQKYRGALNALGVKA